MENRLKSLLEKANSQIKRSGNEKNFKPKNLNHVNNVVNVNEIPVAVISNKPSGKLKNEKEEIKEYLQQLSRKTQPEVDTGIEKENEISSVSTLEELEKELNLNSSKFSSNQKTSDKIQFKKNKTLTALQRLTHYEDKYLRSQPQKSHLLDTESDISLIESDNIAEKKSASKITTDDFISIQQVLSSSSTSLQRKDFHLVDELQESVHQESFSKISDEVESIIENSESVIKTESNNEPSDRIVYWSPPPESTDNQKSQSSVISKEETLSNITDKVDFDVKDQSPSKQSSENLLRNVHFDTFSDEAVTAETSSTSSSSTGDKFPTKSLKSIGTQTSERELRLNVTPVFGIELESPSSLTLTNVLIKQGTLDAITVSNPAMLALNEMIKEQINFTKSVLISRHSLYSELASSIQPDYRYTTWRTTIKDVHTFKRKY